MIRVEGLTIADRAGRSVLDRVSLAIQPGERVGIVGESGSGKTTLALALLGAVRPGLRTAGGTVAVDGNDVLALHGRALRAVRAQIVSYLPQDPASALTPTARVRRQVTELATDRSAAEVARRLRELGLPGDRAFQRRYPHQLSGGQQQRLALARAMAGDPRVLVLDEPTTGLDALARDVVLDQIDDVVRRRGMTLVLITHDLDAAARMTDRLLVLCSGEVVEDGVPAEVLEHPGHPYTRRLVSALPRIDEAPLHVQPAVRPAPVLSVAGLRAGYRDHPAVQDVSFEVGAGECVALLGASGSGKTTIARCLSGTHRRDGGSIVLAGEPVAARVRDRTVEQRRRIQVVPQDSAGALNPRRTVGASVVRPLRRFRGMDAATAAVEARRLLTMVGLPAEFATRYPAQLSGGQRQRVTIASALAADPKVLVCDEMTSSLDVQVQAAVLALVAELRGRLGLAVVLITHDLGVIARMADRVVVIDGGRVRAEGPVARVLRPPHDERARSLAVAAQPVGLTAAPAEGVR